MGRLYVQIQNSGFFFESEKPGRAELGFRRRTPLEWTAAFGWGLGSLLFTAHPVLWLGPEGLRLGESCSRISLPAWLVNPVPGFLANTSYARFGLVLVRVPM